MTKWTQLLKETKATAQQFMGKLFKSKNSSVSTSPYQNYAPCRDASSALTPLVDPHQCRFQQLQEIQATYSSTLSLVKVSASVSSSSLVRDNSELNLVAFRLERSNCSAVDIASQFTSLWDAQLYLGEIPGMLMGSCNLLEPCYSLDTPGSLSITAPRSVPESPAQALHRGWSQPSSSNDARSYALSRSPSLASSFFPSSSLQTDGQHPYSYSYLSFQQDRESVHPLDYESTAGEGASGGEDEHESDNRGAVEVDGMADGVGDQGVGPDETDSSGLGSYGAAPTASLEIAAQLSSSLPCPLTTPTVGIMSSPMSSSSTPMGRVLDINDLRHDRKDSGVFVQDDDDGSIMKMLPRPPRRLLSLSVMEDDDGVECTLGEINGEDPELESIVKRMAVADAGPWGPMIYI